MATTTRPYLRDSQFWEELGGSYKQNWQDNAKEVLNANGYVPSLANYAYLDSLKRMLSDASGLPLSTSVLAMIKSLDIANTDFNLDTIARYFSSTTNVSGSDVISHIGDTSRPPQIGRASDFDGTNHINYGYNSLYDFAVEDFTLGWGGQFNILTGTHGIWSRTVNDPSTPRDWDYALIVLPSSGIVRILDKDGAHDLTGLSFSLGIDYFIYASFYGTNADVIINGTIVGTITGLTTSRYTSTNELVAGNVSGYTQYLNAKTYQLSLLNKRITESEALQLETNDVTSLIDNLVVYDTLDNVSLTTSYNRAGNGLHGTKNSWSVSNNYEGDDVPYSAQNRKGYSKGLIKSTADSWGTGGILVSANEFSGDFTFSFKGLETVYYRYIGISDAALSGLGNTSIDYAFYLQNAGVADVRESGALRTSTFAYTKASIFKIQRNGSTITYYHNDTLIYTSLVAFASPIKIDMAVYSQNCTIAPCLIDGVKVELADNANFTTEFFPLLESGLDVLNYSADNKGQVSYTANVVSGTFADQAAGFAETDTAVVDLNPYEAPATRGLPNNFVATDTPTSLNIDNMFIKRVGNVIKDLKITDPDITLTNAKVQAMKDSGAITEWNENTYTIT
jgi:hypothetical protein